MCWQCRPSPAWCWVLWPCPLLATLQSAVWNSSPATRASKPWKHGSHVALFCLHCSNAQKKHATMFRLCFYAHVGLDGNLLWSGERWRGRFRLSCQRETMFTHTTLTTPGTLCPHCLQPQPVTHNPKSLSLYPQLLRFQLPFYNHFEFFFFFFFLNSRYADQPWEAVASDQHGEGDGQHGLQTRTGTRCMI